ncbi:hypothetical protein RB195_023840 [Necator americanus]|uniref:Reverse transcriptase domain-containing protein n=1 Tax=Necator americanus TaxID=51031 RepID=A0ABR1EKS6_NECAM
MQLAFLDFEAAFDSSHRGRLLNALRADGVPGKFIRLLDDMNQRTTAAVRTPDGLQHRLKWLCHNEDLYTEIDVVYRWMTRGKHQHPAPPSKVAKVNRLRFFGHILRRPANRLVQRVLKSLPGSSWKKPRGRKRKFWTEEVKEDMRTRGVDRQFRRDRIEKVGKSCVQGRHISAKMRVIASGDDISPPIKSKGDDTETLARIKVNNSLGSAQAK